jgi:4-hydroxy-tetrahydrodipicolinate reductase
MMRISVAGATGWFGLSDERLTIRHDAGSSAAPYVAGTLLAIRALRDRVGLTRGLDTLLLGGPGCR